MSRTELERSPRSANRRATRPTVIDPHQLYSIDEYCAARDKSRAGAYQEIKAGEIRIVKEGGRSKVLGAEIIRRNLEVAGVTAANISD